ncbi:MAG: hypothetical protein IIB14_07605 [Chloroflexi bacterium]|nr:hypothetical protein [Chloroflexota bacterium]
MRLHGAPVPHLDNAGALPNVYVRRLHGRQVDVELDGAINVGYYDGPLSEHIDILAHPGLISLEDAGAAVENGIFPEVSEREDHGPANGHVVGMVKEAGAKMVPHSDAHAPEDLPTREYAAKVELGARSLESLKMIGVVYP